jgi:hypothetical protein
LPHPPSTIFKSIATTVTRTILMATSRSGGKRSREDRLRSSGRRPSMECLKWPPETGHLLGWRPAEEEEHRWLQWARTLRSSGASPAISTAQRAARRRRQPRRHTPRCPLAPGRGRSAPIRAAPDDPHRQRHRTACVCHEAAPAWLTRATWTPAASWPLGKPACRPGIGRRRKAQGWPSNRESRYWAGSGRSTTNHSRAPATSHSSSLPASRP